MKHQTRRGVTLKDGCRPLEVLVTGQSLKILGAALDGLLEAPKVNLPHW